MKLLPLLPPLPSLPRMRMAPFWRYYGGKFRAAPRYPIPKHAMIIEPFAGAAGYSLRYPERQVLLVEKYPIVAELWRYLISVSAAEIRSVPEVEHVDCLPGGIAEGARHLVGFWLNAATVSPRKKLSAGRIKLRSMGRKFEGWNAAVRERIARQVECIRHWRIIEGDYTAAPNFTATWFIDPPYNNQAGSYYVHSKIDYVALGGWCQRRLGRVIVCENKGADWLPFQPFAKLKAGVNGKGSEEVIWFVDRSE